MRLSPPGSGRSTRSPSAIVMVTMTQMVKSLFSGPPPPSFPFLAQWTLLPQMVLTLLHSQHLYILCGSSLWAHLSPKPVPKLWAGRVQLVIRPPDDEADQGEWAGQTGKHGPGNDR